MTLAALTEAVRARIAAAEPLNARVKFDLGADGLIVVDATGREPRAGNADAPADTTLTMSAEVLRRLLDGTLDPTLAYMTGKLKVEGSMGVALKLTSMFAD